MRTAQWQVVNQEILLWLDDDEVESTEDRFPILRRWMEEFLQALPFILDDYPAERWLEQQALDQNGVVAFHPHNGGRRPILMGGIDIEVLRVHQSHWPESWTSGLRVAAFDSQEAMMAQLSDWSGRPDRLLTRDVGQALFVLWTYADAQCLRIQPGRHNLPILLNQAEEIGQRLGYSWQAL